MLKRILMVTGLAFCIGLLSLRAGLNIHQSMSLAIFSFSILGTLFFWEFRLSFAFLGTSALLFSKTIDVEHLVRFASLEVIMFLVGMMILMGLLRENGFFAWVTHSLLSFKHITAKKFVFYLAVLSAVMSATTSEVISIIFMVAAILKICEHLDIDCVPFVIISVLATNIGSAATVLGNPIGILIAVKSGLTFEDFLCKALPLSIVCLAASIFVCIFWYRKTIDRMDESLKKAKADRIANKYLPVHFGKDLKISVGVFLLTLFFIALHHRIEQAFGLAPNTVLLAMPLVSSGLVMIWKWKKARDYVEKDVEWWTLLFFMLLFAQAGTLQYTGTTDELARRIASMSGNSLNRLIALVLWISTIGSAVLDNVVLVAAAIPVVQSFKALGVNLKPLWWALLFGGCMGGNITLVGSTANIIALGIVEKEKRCKITFMRWFGIGLTVGLVTTVIVWISLVVFPIYH